MRNWWNAHPSFEEPRKRMAATPAFKETPCNKAWRLIVFTFLAFLLIQLAALPRAASEMFTYRDKLHRTVGLKTPVKRAVIFQTYEMIPALDIWDQVVGLGRYAYDNDLIKAIKPDIAKTIPSAGAGLDLNFEALMALKPEVIITWTVQPGVVKFLEEKGFTVISVYPDSLKELYEVMEVHGKLFGKEAQVRRCIAEMEAVFDIARERGKALMGLPQKRVLWIGSKPTNVACGDGLTNELIVMSGGVNVAGSLQGGNVEVSIERIVAWNPEVIFIWGHAKYQPEAILNSPQWRFVKAVKNGNVFKAPSWNTWSPRVALLGLWMGSKIHPELYSDLDMTAVFDAFYRNVFHIPYARIRAAHE
ncbi:MAG: ABC transporter substrate-binding protein [Desulfomonilaceae bacterium]